MTYTPPEALVERVDEAIQRRLPNMLRAAAREAAKTALAATPLGELVEALERLSRMLPAVLHGERDVVDLREIIDTALARAKGETP